jgi:hypothetical protein
MLELFGILNSKVQNLLNAWTSIKIHNFTQPDVVRYIWNALYFRARYN